MQFKLKWVTGDNTRFLLQGSKGSLALKKETKWKHSFVWFIFLRKNCTWRFVLQHCAWVVHGSQSKSGEKRLRLRMPLAGRPLWVPGQPGLGSKYACYKQNKQQKEWRRVKYTADHQLTASENGSLIGESMEMCWLFQFAELSKILCREVWLNKNSN